MRLVEIVELLESRRRRFVSGPPCVGDGNSPRRLVEIVELLESTLISVPECVLAGNGSTFVVVQPSRLLWQARAPAPQFVLVPGEPRFISAFGLESPGSTRDTIQHSICFVVMRENLPLGIPGQCASQSHSDVAQVTDRCRTMTYFYGANWIDPILDAIEEFAHVCRPIIEADFSCGELSMA